MDREGGSMHAARKEVAFPVSLEEGEAVVNVVAVSLVPS